MIVRRGQAGLTLVETLVAMVIAGVVGLAVQSGYRMLAQFEDLGRRSQDENELLTTLLVTMKRDLAANDSVGILSGNLTANKKRPGAATAALSGVLAPPSFVLFTYAYGTQYPGPGGTERITWTSTGTGANSRVVRRRCVGAVCSDKTFSGRNGSPVRGVWLSNVVIAPGNAVRLVLNTAVRRPDGVTIERRAYPLVISLRKGGTYEIVR